MNKKPPPPRKWRPSSNQRSVLNHLKRGRRIMITYSDNGIQYSWADGGGAVDPRTVQSLLKREVVFAADPGLVDGCPQTIGAAA